MSLPPVIAPGACLGILGGGQLGRMLGMAARQLGYRVVVYSPPGDTPAAAIADRVFAAAWDDEDAVRAFAAAADVVTYEFENVPVATVLGVERVTPVRPSAALLGVTQDRLAEHALLDREGLPHAKGWPVRSERDLLAGIAALGFPARLKTARGGYDGGGQWRIRDEAGITRARTVVREMGATFRLEGEVAFDQEVSVIVTRGLDGASVTFPVFENEHHDGILALTRCPARVSPRVASRARDVALALAEAVGLVGTLTVECFVVGDDVLVNELAPRVHNSGHLTIEACATSQFEQHLRAVCGLPLGATDLRRPAAMANLLGDCAREVATPRGFEEALAAPDTHLHLYGKASVRPRRKMGHLTVVAESADEAVARARAAGGAIGW